MKDNQSEKEVYRLIHWRPGLYQLRTDSQSVQIEIQEGRYLFGPQGMPAVAQTERISEAEWIPPTGLDIEPYFRTILYEDVSSSHANNTMN